MRVSVLRALAAIKINIRRYIDIFGRRLYNILMPYPKIRLVLSKINGKIKIYRNPQKIISAGHLIKYDNYKYTDQGIQFSNGLKTPKNINVAMIVDEFSYNSYRYECNAFPLEPDNWLDIFSANKIDLFFCESAFSGVDSQRRPWKGQIYASVNFEKENRVELLKILEYCKSRKILTIFWNKEDPAHYDDRIHDFVKTALLFDHIFTTSSECVERYKSEYGHKNTHLLMFATQPGLFNPIEIYDRTDEIIFAGSWYRQHPARSAEMEKILDTIMDSPYPLKIYDRQSENDDPNHKFPEKYAPFIHPRVSHDSLDIAYKGSKYALNINTVTESATMFARRVFELMSSNTLVLTNYSKGIDYFFGDNVAYINGADIPALNNYDEKREICLYKVLAYHTYQRRFKQILIDTGIPYLECQPSVSLRYHVADRAEAEASIDHYHRVDWLNKHCSLVVDGRSPPNELQFIAGQYNGAAATVYSMHYNDYYNNFIEKDNAYDYVITATTELDHVFLNKAMLHVSYLDKATAIMPAENIREKYRLTKIQPRGHIEHILIPLSELNSENITVYAI